MTEPNYKIYDCEDWIVVHNLEKSELLMIDRNYLIITMSDISILGTLDISNVYSSHGLVGILQLGQCECLIFIKACQRVGDIGSKAIFSVSEVEVLTINNKCEFPNFITAIRNLFSNGFYFSHNFDLTSSLETQKNAKIQQDSYYDIILHSDKSFLWNCNLIKKLLDFKIGSNYVVNLIQGFVGFISEELTINNESVKLNYILISRRQIDNAGLFSFKKGVDINGHVANFVETEQIAIIAKNIFSFVQHRGTAPIDYNLNYMDSMNKFQKHINNICQKYKLLFLINLMNSENNEQNLTDHFENLIQEANNKNVKYSYFDYDKETSLNCNSIEDFLNRMESILSIFKFFAIINQGNSDESIITKSIEQIGVIRTNCYDALDRTNKIQMNIAWKILIKQLNMTNVDAKVISNDKLKFTNRVDIFFDENLSTDTFMDKFIDLWETNNTRLKEFYLGNNSSLDIFPIENGIVSPTDQILLQKCIDLINKWEINTKISDDIINKELENHLEIFTQYEDLGIFIGTWNVAGRSFKEHLDLRDWLGQDLKQLGKTPDIYCVGLQEIVELNANYLLLSSNSTKVEYWKNTIQKTLSQIDDYVLVTCYDLIGVFLSLYVKRSLKEHIRNIDYLIIKTGMMGAMGNKGSCVVRFNYYDTTIAFSTGHFAAGSSSNNARLSEMNEILNKSFPHHKLKKFREHSAFFLFGDLNFRLDLDYQLCMDYIKTGNVKDLKLYDQFYKSHGTYNFSDLNEGNLNFFPTYKYTKESNEYDSKSKRVPSWCDRIFYKKSRFIRQIVYNRSELRHSDHRPIYSIFKVFVGKEDKKKKEELINKIKHKIILGTLHTDPIAVDYYNNEDALCTNFSNINLIDNLNSNGNSSGNNTQTYNPNSLMETKSNGNIDLLTMDFKRNSDPENEIVNFFK